MPQLDQFLATYASQFFWMAITFGLLYFGIARAMLPKVGKLVDDRAARIAGDLSAAEAARAAAQAATAEETERLTAARRAAQALLAEESPRLPRPPPSA
ncbi:hypothetical protein E6W36_11475 [Hankyongella ginsenosidimutans]|uniref:ATP synthase YMF19-like N-terminal domain-containing protein n=1 Tax=Hankyongella ginsenosidimutans TaxID=1763828 RepID=A0A4D7C7C0_9SPHN|nr:hypothetical protein [Hankyongella ginsenosidimutans]QCI79900.1 hypothetical protein E6W36_11475 [Hankyongella ginsenosidimutans]